MNSQKLKTISYCVGGKHHSGTKDIAGEITINKKTSREVKLLVGKCVICNRKKSMIVSDNTIKAEGLGSFFKNLGKISAKAGKKLATNVLKTLAEPWKLLQTLQQQPQPKVQKQHYQHYLK